MKLYKVKKGCWLKWHSPKGWPGRDTHRGGEGYIVDLDAPLESMFCGTQMRKLRPIDKGEPSPIKNSHALALIREASKPKAEPDVKSEPKPEPKASNLPTVDKPAKAK